MTRPLRSKVRILVRAGTARFRALPSFLIIGAHKAGTTSLHVLVKQHPAVVGPDRKEVNFFSQHWDRGLGHYRASFPLHATMRSTARTAGVPAMTFESSPGYLLHPRAPSRVKSALPEARFVVLMRNPTDRAYSGYLHACRQGRETLPFGEALRAERQRREADERGEAWSGTLNRSYVARGRYLDHLERWWAEFPRERFLLIASDDLFVDPAGTAGRVFDFLGLPAFTPTDLRARNQGEGPPLDPIIRAELDATFAEANQRLFEETGIDVRSRGSS